MVFQDLRRILVVKLSSLGDIVHVTPCLRALRNALPRASIVMAVESRFAALLRNNPNVDELIEANAYAATKLHRFLETRSSLARYTRSRFDLAIDFQGLARSALWVYLSRAPLQLGLGGIRPGWQRVVPPDYRKHSIVECADVLRGAGVTVDRLDPEIFSTAEGEEVVVRTLSSVGIPQAGYLLVNPFSRCFARTWPLDRYAELIARLCRQRPLPIVISGGPAEARRARRLAAMVGSPRAVSLAGRFSLEHSFSLFRRAALMVTGDTGPMHLAAALGKRCIALFGPSLPERNGPWGPGHRVIQIHKPPHHHAFRHDPERHYMRAIDVDTVFSAVVEALEETGVARAA